MIQWHSLYVHEKQTTAQNDARNLPENLCSCIAAKIKEHVAIRWPNVYFKSPTVKQMC